MKILLTNDDGIDAPGLARLVQVVSQFGEPIVVAPEVCHSAKSHAISMRGPIRIEERDAIHGARAFSCSGTPADCVRVGLEQISIPGIERVCAGINPGANCGVDVFYSGTVAAAREAALLGVPGIAVSQLVRSPDPLDWDATSERARTGLEAVFALGANLPILTNLNLPATRNEPVRGIRWCHLSVTAWPMDFAPHTDNGGGFTTEYVGSYLSRAATDGDYPSLVDGYITLTPMQLDTTDYDQLGRIQTDASVEK